MLRDEATTSVSKPVSDVKKYAQYTVGVSGTGPRYGGQTGENAWAVWGLLWTGIG